jgi:hypothetical protein
MPVLLYSPLSPTPSSLALIVPGLLQKQQLAADGDSFRNYRVDLSRLCAGVTHFPRRRKRAKPQSIKRGIAGQPDDLYGDDHRRLA